MKLEDVRLHRDDLVLIKEWHPHGCTESGIILDHSDALPKIFGDVILAPGGACVKEGDFIVFPRYAGEPVDLDDGRFHFLNVDDVEAIAEFND